MATKSTPSTTQYDTKRAVYVKPFSTSPILYGFKTNVKETTSTECGHVAVNPASLPTNLVFGANAPKPGRATRQTTTGSESSFYDIDKYSALKQAGYSLSRPSYRLRSSGRRSYTVYVTIGAKEGGAGGIKYAWNMPKSLYDQINSEMTALGIRVADGSETDLVFGASSPKPPKASKVLLSDGGSRTLSTFFDPSKDTLPEGWSGAGKQYINVG